jgi:hypothetical protein
MKSIACALRASASAAAAPSGTIMPSYITDGPASSEISTSSALPSAAFTLPSMLPTRRGTAPSANSAAYSWLTWAPSTPGATRIATRRVLMPVSPGRLSKDSAGDGI